MTLAQLALEIDPTPAMDAGTQTVWQCSMCGTVVVLTSLADVTKPQACPAGHDAADWWRQSLPVAGLRARTAAVERGVIDQVLAFLHAENAPGKGYGRLMDRLEEALEGDE